MHDVQRRAVKKLPALRGRTVINLFFEDSTRTRSSFEIAGKWLSADTINITGKGSSAFEGREPARHRADDLRDGRRRARGAPRRERRGPRDHGWVDASVVNAGDGTHEHPTQALLGRLHADRHLGGLEGRRVVLVGDLTHSRVFRSKRRPADAPGRRRVRRRPADPDARGDHRLGRGRRVRDVVGPRRRAAARRRRDDAAGPARAHERRVLPHRPRVRRVPTPDPRPPGGAARRGPGAPPGADEPRPGDLRRRPPTRRPRWCSTRSPRASPSGCPCSTTCSPARSPHEPPGPAPAARPRGDPARRQPGPTCSWPTGASRRSTPRPTRAGTTPRCSTPRASSCCPGWSTSTPTCASPAARTPRRSPPGPRPPRPGGSPPCWRWPTRPGHRHRRGRRAGARPRRAAGSSTCRPVGAITRGLEGHELAELGLMHRSPRRRDGLLRRRPLRGRRPGDASGPGVRQGVRRRRRPARPGPRPRRAERLLPRGRALGPPRPARLAGPSRRRRSSRATSCWRATPAPGSTSATSPRPARSRCCAGPRPRGSRSPPR